MLKALPPGWVEKLAPVKKEPYFIKLQQFLAEEYRAGKMIYPAKKNIFRALQEVDLPAVKVVILGQDPYHGPGQATGFSFAVPNALKRKPPSLRNIFKELESDLKIQLKTQESDLTGWVAQGVLLLNTVLTVEAEKPLSHRNQGWELFTDRIIEILNQRIEPMVFILWGSHAQKLKAKLDLKRHRVLESVHPSPLSAYRGFFGSKVFSKSNESLNELKQSPVRWEKISG
ncbi:MAG: uracil-DNA glycosylase [Bdellovibrionales bacterium]|nr:uracil-DNA glycosylase [Oligoflexia bacterium]